jgi:hypothetical protein
MTMAGKKATAVGRQVKTATWENRFTDEFKAQPAQLTAEQREILDAHFSNNEMWRRFALVTLSRSGAELIETVNETRDNALHYARGADQASEYATILRSFADMMDTASMRLHIALCSRPDMQVILDEVKAVDAGYVVGHG